jgi:hypothetical protein
MPKVRYCRLVFTKEGEKIEIDFGFYNQEQKNEGIRKFRESYADYAFFKYYSIESPNWAEPELIEPTDYTI